MDELLHLNSNLNLNFSAIKVLKYILQRACVNHSDLLDLAVTLFMTQTDPMKQYLIDPGKVKVG